MTKFKKYENYKKTNIDWLDEIPSNWNMLPNRAIFRERITRNCDKEELLSVTIKNGIIKQTQLLKNSSKKDSSNEDKSKYKLVKINDIAYNKMRMWQGAVGVSNYQGIVSPAYIILNPRADINSKYYHYLYRSPKYIRYSYNYSYGICDDQLSLRYKDFSKMYSVIPPKEEQNKIVDFIEHKEKQINKLIKKQKKLIELLEEKKKIIITEAVTKGLDKSIPMKDSGIDYIGQIPQNWEVRKLKFITLCNKYTLEEQTDKNKRINYIDIGSVTNKDGITDVQEMLFKDAPSRARRIVHTNDTIISTVRTYLKAIAYIDEKYDNYICSTGFAVITPKNNVDSRFLFYLLHSDKFICEVERISTGANYPAITPTKLINLKCLMPNIQEQIKIRKYVEKIEMKINKSIDNKNTLIDRLEEYKKTLISYAVTGQIDVRDYEFSETDDNIDLDEIENISEDDTETISEVEYANN